jgi:hypothetical protein
VVGARDDADAGTHARHHRRAPEPHKSGHEHAFPFLVPAGWALVSCAVFWIWRHRHPGGRDTRPAHVAE